MISILHSQTSEGGCTLGPWNFDLEISSRSCVLVYQEDLWESPKTIMSNNDMPATACELQAGNMDQPSRQTTSFSYNRNRSLFFAYCWQRKQEEMESVTVPPGKMIIFPINVFTKEELIEQMSMYVMSSFTVLMLLKT